MKMKLLPLLFSTIVANKTCGCDASQVAANYIKGGTGTAVCTKESIKSKNSSKGSIWTLTCGDQSKSVKMGNNCKVKKPLRCSSGGNGGNPTCKSLSKLQAANPNATFTCNGKKETVECKIGDKTNTKTDKGKGLLKWAKSSKCTADNNGGGFTCACSAETASLQNIQCVSQDTYSCTKKDGKTGTFSAKAKCKKIAKKSGCATTGATTTAAPTTTAATTTAASTASTQAPAECTPNSDGTCGTPKEIESYVYVNFEGETSQRMLHKCKDFSIRLISNE